MARPLRYEAAGAVYHVIARGDGGKMVFEDDKDRYGWVDLLERVCGRFGWRVHAWVLMGNHFHLLLETPEPNLVAGMKWMLGVYAQGWNRRRERKGHAALIRKRTGVKNRWVAERLGMGHEGNVTRAIRRVNGDRARKSNLAKLEAMLVSRD